MTIETNVQNEFNRSHWTNFVSGLPEEFKTPDNALSAGRSGEPPSITAVGNPEFEPEKPIFVTPLEYNMPNPNSRYGVHSPREVYASGFPNWFPKDTKNKITQRIDTKM